MNEQILLSAEWLDSPKCRAVPGAIFDYDAKAYVIPEDRLTPRGAAVALRLFPGLGEQYPILRTTRDSHSQDVRPINRAHLYSGERIGWLAPRTTRSLHNAGLDWFNFQSEDLSYAAAVLAEHRAYYLGWERGLGKTLGAIALAEAAEASRTLVVCPNTAKQAVWGDDLARWRPDLQVVVVRNPKRQRELDIAKIKQLSAEGYAFMAVFNYEQLAVIERMRAGKKGWQLMPPWDLLILDEGHRISNTTRHKNKSGGYTHGSAMRQALKRIPTNRKLLLSGSIIMNHAEELYGQLNWLLPEQYKAKWRDWNDRFLDYVDGGYGKICVGVRIECLEAMREELGVFMSYRRKEDELDLPPRTVETRYVDLSPGQRIAYDDLEATCLTRLESDEVLKATDGLTLLTRLRQVATGLDLLSGELVDSAKLDLAVELIKDNPDEAFVVFSWYKRGATALAERLDSAGIASYCITGDTKLSDRTAYIQDFQAGNRQVFIGTISTLGESVTLHRACNAVFLDRSWNPGDNDQAADRIYRIGQERPVTITHIVARDTVDTERVLPVLTDKSALRATILGYKHNPE